MGRSFLYLSLLFVSYEQGWPAVDTLAAYAEERFHNDVINSDLHQQNSLFATKIDIIGTKHVPPSCQLPPPGLGQPTLEPRQKKGERDQQRSSMFFR